MVSFLTLSVAMLNMITVGLSVPLVDALTNPSGASRSQVIASVRKVLIFLGVSHSANVIILSLFVLGGVLFITRSALSLIQQYFTARMAHKVRRRTKFALFESSLRSRYEDQSKRDRGAILHDINIPAGAMYNAITSLGSLVTGLFNAVLLIALMVYLSWWAALMVSVIAICGVHGLQVILDRRAYFYGRVVYELQREIAKVEVDSIDGLKVVKAGVLESKMVDRQQSLLMAEERPMLRGVLLRSAPSFINELGSSLTLLTLGGITFLLPSMGMHFSTLVAFLLAIRRVSPAMASINVASVDLNRARRDLEVVNEVLHLIPWEKHGQRSVGKVKELRLADVSFYYESRPEEWVVKGIDLVMRRGTVTALVGPTGSGKSTIANLLVGLYAPRSGALFVNDVDLQLLDLTAWRRKIGYVSQDTYLFNATLRENIVLWDETVSQQELEWAARVAQLHDFVLTLPDGYDTIVGDRGLRLSGGQCQRVAIARAVLRRPEVLIFDEATSALDNLTESAVYEAISALRRDTIVMIIAHRLSTIKDADQIAVLWLGKVIEVGAHETLMSMGGAYADLYQGDGSQKSEAAAELSSRLTIAERQENE